MNELEVGTHKYINSYGLGCLKCGQYLTWRAHHVSSIGDIRWESECECGALYKVWPTGFKVVALRET